MGGGSHHDAGRWPTGAGARYVRARLSHGLWRGGRALCRHLYGGDPLGQRGEAVQTIQQRKLTFAVRDTLHKDARSTVKNIRAIVSRRTLQILALTIVLPATTWGSIARA